MGAACTSYRSLKGQAGLPSKRSGTNSAGPRWSKKGRHEEEQKEVSQEQEQQQCAGLEGQQPQEQQQQQQQEEDEAEGQQPEQQAEEEQRDEERQQQQQQQPSSPQPVQQLLPGAVPDEGHSETASGLCHRPTSSIGGDGDHQNPSLAERTFASESQHATTSRQEETVVVTSIASSVAQLALPESVDSFTDWAIDDDSSEIPLPMKAVSVDVSGFCGEDAIYLNGQYQACLQVNHGRQTFSRATSEQGEGSSNLTASPKSFLYYWDARDGEHLRGWWFGPSVGANNVWAFNPGHANEPPVWGWREPWFNDVSRSARVLLSTRSCKDWLRRAPAHEMALAGTVKSKLQPVFRQMRVLSGTWKCMDCQAFVKSPVVLPCGHMVCQSHTYEVDESLQHYCCPWSTGCTAKRFPGVLGQQGWCTSSLADRLLALAPPPSEEEEPPTPREQVTVPVARTPTELAQAYEELGDELGEEEVFGMAAVACVAARCTLEEFGDRLDVGGRDHIEEVSYTQKVVRVKAASWAKCSSNPSDLQDATESLPLPQLDAAELAAGKHLSSLATRLHEASEHEGLLSLLECPICYAVLFNPITTPCGHTYCRRCLARSLDWGKDCPLCRGELSGSIEDYSVCEPLKRLLEVLLPEVQSKRREEEDEEFLPPAAGEWLPVLSPMLILPFQQCTLHILEPHQRLLMRHVASSGTNRVGACSLDLASFTQGTDIAHGTELTIGRIRALPDGSGSLVEVVGGRRFKVLEAWTLDGYSKARIQHLDDDESADQVAPLRRLEQALSIVRESDALSFLRWGTMARVGSVLDMDRMGRAQRTELLWELLLTLPIGADAKAAFLGMTTEAERVSALLDVLQALNPPCDEGVQETHAESAASSSNAQGQQM